MDNTPLFYITELINAIPEILIIALFFHNVLTTKRRKCVRIIGYCAAYIVMAAVSVLAASPYIRMFFYIGSLLGLAFFLYSDSFWTKLFSAAYCTLVFFISETLFVGILTLSGFGNSLELLQTGQGRFFGMVGTKILEFWLIVYSCRIYKKKVKSLPLKNWILILIMPLVSVLILNQVFFASYSSEKSLTYYIICAAGLLYINFSVFDYFNSYDTQIRLAASEQMREKESENYRMLESSYAEIRSIKHDLKNQVDILSALIQSEDYPAAQEYIRQMYSYSSVEAATSLCYTGNSALDAVINLKSASAESKGIRFITKISVSSYNIDALNLCRILSNALDNAVEACERVSSSDRFVYLTIKQLENKLIIDVENSSPYVDINCLATTKADKKQHGIGLYSIEKAIKTADGIVSLSYNDGVFSLKAVLPN